MAANPEVRGSRPRVHAETVRRMERATGALGTAAIAAMDERLPWFRNLSAENRSWLGLVAQAGIAAFIDWIRHPERNRPALTEVFATAPRELAFSAAQVYARTAEARGAWDARLEALVVDSWSAARPRSRCTPGPRRWA